MPGSRERWSTGTPRILGFPQKAPEFDLHPLVVDVACKGTHSINAASAHNRFNSLVHCEDALSNHFQIKPASSECLARNCHFRKKDVRSKGPVRDAVIKGARGGGRRWCPRGRGEWGSPWQRSVVLARSRASSASTAREQRHSLIEVTNGPEGIQNQQSR